MKPARLSRPALTLIELMVILAVLIFLLGFLLPILARVRTVNARAETTNNLRQIVIAIHNINDTHKRMPPTVGSFPDQGGNSMGTLHFFLLPYIEQTPLYQKAENFVWKNGAQSVSVPLFLAHEDKSGPPDNVYKNWLATTNFPANYQVFKLGGANIPQSFPDGTSNTIVFAQRYQMCKGHPCAWGYSNLYYWAPMFAHYSQSKFQAMPGQEACDPGLAQSLEPDGINVGLGDGSVRIVANNISPLTWWLACDPRDGHALGNDW